MTNLFHYGADPVPQFDRNQVRTPKVGIKPTGLWLSHGSAWADWCTENDQRRDLGVRTEARWAAPLVSLGDGSGGRGVLNLPTWADVIRFSNMFSVAPEWADLLSANYRVVDWPSVQSRWWGINISEPSPSGLWVGDLPMWISTWDVPSACVWEPQAVTIVGFERTATVPDRRGEERRQAA